MQPREILGSASELATSRSVIHFCGLQALWAPAGSLGNWEAYGKVSHRFLATPAPGEPLSRTLKGVRRHGT